MKKDCFIIASPGKDLSTLVQIIEDAGWSTLNRESIRPGASSFLAETSQLIQSATAVLVLLDDDNDPSLFIEIGFAVGSGRPLLLIGPDAAIMDGDAPDRVLAGLPRVNATVADEMALRLHVPAFLDSINNPDTTRRSPSEGFQKVKTQALFPSTRSATPLEKQIFEILQESNEVKRVAVQPRSGKDRSYIPDFAIWIEDNTRTLANPVLIEVESIHSHPMPSVIDRIKRYAINADVQVVLLIEEGGLHKIELVEPSPLIFRVGLHELHDLTTTGRLVDAMRLERNRFFHSAI